MEIKNTSRFLSRRSFLRQSSLVLASLALSGRQLLAQHAISSWHNSMELAIDFEILGRGKKPYVAVWIEDWTGQSVRTLYLWMQQRRGEKYLPDLRRWHRNEQTRQQTHGGDLIRTVSSPTRRPGQYSVIWDGLNDRGQSLRKGDYYVCVESARENGPYHLIRGRVTLENASFTERFTGDAELGDVHVEFRHRA